MQGIAGLVVREWLIIRKTSVEFVGNLLGPIWTLLLFAPGLAAAIGSVGGTPYGEFILPGIVVMNGFVTGQAAAYPIFFDRLTGEQENLFALPVRRLDIVAVRCGGAALRAAVQGVLIVLIGMAVLGIAPTWSGAWRATLAAALIAALTTAALAAVASGVKNPNAVNVVLNAISAPLVLSSTIYYPLEAAPAILRPLGAVNPVTIACRLARGEPGATMAPLLLLLSLLGAAFGIAARLFPRSLDA